MLQLPLARTVFNLRNEYIQGTSHEVLDVVRHLGCVWACTRRTLEAPGHESRDWMLLIEDVYAKIYDLGEFYSFRHPEPRPGMEPADGRWIENADEKYPLGWAYLQTPHGQRLCVTETEYTAMNTAFWHTNADGSKVGWNGVGGVPFHCLDIPGKRLRVPDIRGMVSEAAGCDSLGAGGAHGDAGREIEASIAVGTDSWTGRLLANPSGAFILEGQGNAAAPFGTTTAIRYMTARFIGSRVVPTAAKFQTRAWGSLACVYLGLPTQA
jgi:hypothetical protein